MERTKFSVEHKDLDKYVQQLEYSEAELLPEAKRIVARGAYNIKKDAKSRAPRGPHLPYYADSITYETTLTKSSAYAEIGPDKHKRQGALGNLLEYGSPSSPAHPHMGPAGEAEQPKFAAAMEKLASKSVEPNDR